MNGELTETEEEKEGLLRGESIHVRSRRASSLYDDRILYGKIEFFFLW
jgi:hypothetical protein